MAVKNSQTDYVSKSDLIDFGKDLSNKIVDDLTDVINQLAINVDHRFNQLEENVTKLEKSIDRQTNTLDGFASLLESLELDISSRNLEYRRLLTRAEKVPAKSGIPSGY